MKTTRAPVLAGGDIILTIGGLVKMARADITTKALRARLKRQRARDLTEGIKVDWFIPGKGRRSADRYNFSKLERAHPALFKSHYVDPSEYESLVEQMDSFREMLNDEKKRLNALIAAHRETRRMLKTA